jgi:hypothetical protein
MGACPRCKGEVVSGSFCNHCGLPLHSPASFRLEQVPASRRIGYPAPLFGTAATGGMESAKPRSTRWLKIILIFLGTTALLLVLMVWLLVAYGSSQRRATWEQLQHKQTELSQDEAYSVCLPQAACDGKFVVWHGVVKGNVPVGSTLIKVSLDREEFYFANIQLGYPISAEVHSGDEVLFHGHIRGRLAGNSFNINDGYIRTTLATDSQRMADYRRAQQEGEARAAADKLAQEAKDAGQMGVSLENYQNAEANLDSASVSCKLAVVNQNQWGGDADWGSGYSWRVDGNDIILNGHDVQLKNGFGAEGRVSYECIYDLTAKTAVVASVQ